MREEIIRMGFQELTSSDDVQREVETSSGTVFVFVNSVCGCAAGIARPGIALALSHGAVPDKLTTTFAGVQLEAVDRVRGLFADYPPSSPQAALFKDGQVVEVIQRHQIEGSSPEHFAGILRRVFDSHCAGAAAD
jgi:putative YphP/YqiW family bacilliredoxin